MLFDSGPQNPSPVTRKVPAPRKRVGLKLTAAVVAIVLVGGGAAAVGYYQWCKGASGASDPVQFKIPNGATGGEVISALHAEGVIRCDAVARFQAGSREDASSMVAGRYELTTNMTLDEALAVLAEGPFQRKPVTITIPEGYRLSEIATQASRDLGIPPVKFVESAESGRYSMSPYLPEGTPTLEGFLFPKTYEFFRGEAEATDVIDRMLEQFESEVNGLNWDRSEGFGVTPYEAVIVASMVEREARLPAERPKIAAVIYNRLQKGIKLGIDATVQYIDPDPSNGLTQSDLAIDSQYNTRVNKGLPPTPIANPGLASIKAALDPASTDAMYFVLCGEDGHHEFTETYGEFLQKKAQCLG
ncbi:MAG: endolytic transglycosylase MltG [Actinomycetota bacterium]